MNDSIKHQGQRNLLVNELRRKAITDECVLQAIARVPRHLFIDISFKHLAYKDQALPIDSGQTISQPYTVAFQTQLLQVKKNDKILEIGTGSGYQAAILIEMGAQLFTIERNRALFAKTQHLMLQLGYHAHYFLGDGYEGKKSYAPFDKIIMTAGAVEIPNALLQQLCTGGRLVAPIGDISSQVMTLIQKTGDNEFQKSTHGFFSFVPMLKGLS